MIFCIGILWRIEMRKSILIMAMICGLVMSGCSSPAETKDAQKKAESVGQEITDQATSLIQAEEEHVLMVKNGYPVSYPDCKYGDVFDEFFGSPTWKYFASTDGQDVVEFTGYCMYEDTEVKARLQFILDTENSTFTSGALSFNDVPQTNLMTYGLIEKAFSEYIENHGMSIDDSNSLNAEIEQVFNDGLNEQENNQENETISPDTPYYSDEGDTMATPHVMIENSSDSYLSDSDVYWMTPAQLRYAKNEIYARHGRKFKDAELQAWFSAQSWYQGTIEPDNFSESLLSEIEKANIQVIQHRIEVNSQQDTGNTASSDSMKNFSGKYEANFDGIGGAELEITYASGDDAFYASFSGSYGDSAGDTDGSLFPGDESEKIWYYQADYGSEIAYQLQYDGQDTIIVSTVNGGNFGGISFPGFEGTYVRTEEYTMP
jgi:hypothetical protein